MAIHSSLGLYFMINEVVPFLKKGDMLVISPEYQLFFGKYAYGTKELLYMVWDVNPELQKFVTFPQKLHLVQYISEYVNEKMEYIRSNNWKNPIPKKRLTPGIYDREAFNKHGDVFLHWDMANQDFKPHKAITTPINKKLLKFLYKTTGELEENGIRSVLIYPVYQESSFKKNKKRIHELHTQLVNTGISLPVLPQRYCFPDSLFFNTPYHLNGKGVLKRSDMLLQDLLHAMAP